MADFFELQLKAERLYDLFRIGLLQLGGIHIEPAFVLDGVPSLVAGFEIAQDTAVESLPPPDGIVPSVLAPGLNGPVPDTRVPVINQVLQARIVSIADLEENDGAPAPVRHAPVTLRFVFEAGRTGAGFVRIRFRLVDIDLGSELGAVSNAAALETSLRTSLEPTDVNPDSITRWRSVQGFINQVSAPSFTTPAVGANVNAGIDRDAKLVAVRVELGDADGDSAGQWTRFLQGDIDSLLGDRDWAALIHKNQIRVPLYTALRQWIDALEADDTLTDSSLSLDNVVWSPTASKHLEATMSSAAKDACPGLNPFDWVDLDFNLRARLRFNVPAPDQIEVRLLFYWQVSIWDQIECSTALGLFGPFIAPCLTDFAAGSDEFPGGQMSVGEYLLANFGGPPAYAIGTFVVISNGMNSVVNVPGLGFEEVSPEPGEVNADKAFRRVFSVNLVIAAYDLPDTTSQAEMRATVESRGATADGLVLRGSVTTTIPAFQMRSAELEVEPAHGAIEWGWPKACVTGEPGMEHLRASAAFTLRNKAIQKLGELHQPLVLLSAEVIDDPLQQFAPYLTAFMNDEYGSAGISVPLSALESEYLALGENGYPAKVLLRTSGGARILNLGRLAAPSPGEIGGMLFAMKSYQMAHCRPWQHFLWGKVFNPHWHIDPPPYEQPFESVWELLVDDAVAGSRFTVRSPRLELGRGVADERGRAKLLVTSPVPGESLEAFLEPPDSMPLSGTGIGGGSDRNAAQPAARLFIRQVMLVRQGELRVPAPIRHVAGIRLEGQRGLLVVTAGGASVFSVENPRRPRLRHAISGNFQGAAGWGRGAVLWGSGGAVEWDGCGRPRQLVEDEVLGASTGPHALYVLTNEGVAAFDRHGERKASVEIREGRGLWRAGPLLYVQTACALDRFDIRHGIEPRRLDTLPVRCEALEAVGPTAFGAASVLLRDRDGGRRVARFAPGGADRTAVEYPAGAPWPLTAPVVAGLLLRSDAPRGVIELYRAAAVRQVMADEMFSRGAATG